MFRIMVVEDDCMIADGICKALDRWGYQTACIRNFAQVDEEITAFDASLVLLDISLPYYNGYYWCQKIREHSRIPVIFISSSDNTMDIVMAVSMGGDDYITKPFAPEVLVAKVQAMLRRAYESQAEQTKTMLGNAAYDWAAGTLISGKEKINLTKNENRILMTLIKAQGKIVPREEIMLALWDSDEFVDDNTLTVNINRLRKTLLRAGLPDVIVTHKGQGYQLDV